jgi:hypothetical protein
VAISFECVILEADNDFHAEFDEGDLKADSMKAAEEIIHTLAIMDDTHPPISIEENPIRHMFQTMWLSFKEVRHSVFCKNAIDILICVCRSLRLVSGQIHSHLLAITAMLQLALENLTKANYFRFASSLQNATQEIHARLSQAG